MELREYFDSKSGLGVIATADSEGMDEYLVPTKL